MEQKGDIQAEVIKTENIKKISALAEKIKLPPEQVRDYMCIRLAAAFSVVQQREGRYPEPVMQILKNLQPDKYDLQKVIAGEQSAIDAWLNEDEIDSFHAPKGEIKRSETNNMIIGGDRSALIWLFAKESGQDIASNRPEYLGQMVDAYRARE